MKYIKRKSAVKVDKITGSVVDTFNVNDKTTNAPSLRLMIDLLYPIGRGFLDFTDTDYSNWLGLTWERELVGMTAIGKNPNDTDFATVGAKGGEKEHTLTTNEMPSHTHIQNAHTHTQAQHRHSMGYNSGSAGNYPCNYRSTNTGTLSYTDYQTPTINSTTATNQNTGGGAAHNNLPPYQVVSYWKRVDPNAKKMISFIIYNLEFQAEEGMTWQEWVNSSYNTDEFYVSGNFVFSKASKSISSVTPTDVIISGKTYYYNSEK